MLDAWTRIWSRQFPDSRPSRRRSLHLMRYTISVLTGLAATRMLGGETSRVHTAELCYLKDTLVRELTRAGD